MVTPGQERYRVDCETSRDEVCRDRNAVLPRGDRRGWSLVVVAEPRDYSLLSNNSNNSLLGTFSITSPGRENTFDLTNEPVFEAANRSVKKVMTRQAALLDDSLPHWRVRRLEERALHNTALKPTVEALAQIGLFAEKL